MLEGAVYRRPDALVIIDPTMCTEFKNCIDACPHDMIYFKTISSINTEKNVNLGDIPLTWKGPGIYKNIKTRETAK